MHLGQESIARAGWSPLEFSEATTVCESLVRRFVAAGRIPAVKIGRRRVIVVSPAEWLRQQAESAAY